METLEIASPFSLQHPRPFSPILYEALMHYPALTDFSLRIDCLPHEYSNLTSLPPLAASKHFARLTSLAVSGIRLDGLALRGMLFGCKELRSLTLNDGGGNLDLVSIVKELTNPSSLRKLALGSYESENDEKREIVSFLAKVPLLESLDITGPYDTTSPTFLNALYSLPLDDLAIGAGTLLRPQHVLSLLAPKTRHPFLRRLDLDNIFALRGVTTDPDNPEDVFFNEDGEPTVGPGWILPSWPEDGSWTPAIVEQIREAAEKAGVRVTGTTFEAEQIEDEFDEEEEKVEMFWEMMEELEAMQEEFYDEMYGEEETESEEETDRSEEEEESSEDEPAPRRTLADVD
jgi:hypothetical protein